MSYYYKHYIFYDLFDTKKKVIENKSLTNLYFTMLLVLSIKDRSKNYSTNLNKTLNLIK